MTAIFLGLFMLLTELTPPVAAPRQDRNPAQSILEARTKNALDTYIGCVFASGDKRATTPASAAEVADAALHECGIEYERLMEASRVWMASRVSRDFQHEALRRSDAYIAETRDDVRRAVISRVLTGRERLARDRWDSAIHPGPKAGFRDLAWGDPPPADMFPVPSDSAARAGLAAFLRRGRDGEVAGQETSFIQYAFDKGGLCRVVVAWEGSRDRLELIAASLNEIWGRAGESANGNNVWSSSATVAILHAAEPDVADSAKWSRQLIIADRSCAERAAINSAGL